VRLKEEQLRREEEKVCGDHYLYSCFPLLICGFQLREIELKVQREINEKRQELLAKEESLR
jgi:cell division control protein 11